MGAVLIDYQIKGWAKKSEDLIKKEYSDILYVGDPQSPDSSSSDSVLAAFCIKNGCELLTKDKKAYTPWLEQGAEVCISAFSPDIPYIYRLRAVRPTP